MADDDLVYLLRRAADEKRLATTAGNDSARLAHQGLADAYEQRIRDADPLLSSSAGDGAHR